MCACKCQILLSKNIKRRSSLFDVWECHGAHHEITKSISCVQWFWDDFSPFYADLYCLYVAYNTTITNTTTSRALLSLSQNYFFRSSSPYLSVWCVLCTFISTHFHLLWFHFFLDSFFLFELLLSSILRDSLTHNHIFINLLLFMHSAGSLDICELRLCGNSQE